jgi:hypothetical protein
LSNTNDLMRTNKRMSNKNQIATQKIQKNPNFKKNHNGKKPFQKNNNNGKTI